MERLNNFQSRNDNRGNIIFAVGVVFSMMSPLYASKILKNAKKTLDALKIKISIIIPLAAVVIFCALAIGYADRHIKGDMIR